MHSCEICAFNYDDVSHREIGGELRRHGVALIESLSVGGDGDHGWQVELRSRPTTDTWSPLELGAHCDLVLEVQQRRLEQALVEHLPDWVPSGMDARIVADKHNDRDLAEVRGSLAARVERFAASFDALTPEQLDRTGIYHWPATAERTLGWLGRHTIHELRHHAGDIAAGLTDGALFGPNLTAPNERVALLAWLDHHRTTFAVRCAGASDEVMRSQPIGSSALSLLGIVRHLAEVERYWFQQCWLGQTVPELYASDGRPDADFENVADADVEEAFQTWRVQCAASRRIVMDAPSLDRHARALRHGHPVDLRWILVHMIEEYARHNGHADLLRELGDGVNDRE